MVMPPKNPQNVSDESEDENDEDKRTLFCANLDERVTEDLLYEVFLQAGPIESARIPKDQSGRQRSFGFITYVHACTVPYAMQLFQGLSLYRKNLTIKFQGNTNPSAMRNNNTSPGYNHKRTSYDNSSLRSSNYMAPYNDSPPLNPFSVNYSPDFALNSMMPHQNIGISKHASSQRRLQSNPSPYQRSSSGNNDRNRDREKDRDRDRNREKERDRDWEHDRRRNYNSGSNRHSDQRSGGKSRR